MMFAFFTKSRRKPVARTPHCAWPWLEALEDRWCPTAPQITLSATVMANHAVMLAGQVTAGQIQGLNITFSGAASGSATSNSSGDFSFQTSTATLGTVSAIGVDQYNQSSNTATATIAVAAPTISLQVSYGSQTTITLAGQVSGIDAGGRTVTFSGMATGSVMTNSDGTYSFTTTATALGNVSAQTMDLWGQSSNTAQVTLTNTPPTITNFVALQELGNVWTFEGQVNYAYPQGLTVTLGGSPSLQGVTATVAANGTFYVTVQLQPGEDGTASAQTTDAWGLQSNEALYTFGA